MLMALTSIRVWFYNSYERNSATARYAPSYWCPSDSTEVFSFHRSPQSERYLALIDDSQILTYGFALLGDHRLPADVLADIDVSDKTTWALAAFHPSALRHAAARIARVFPDTTHLPL